MHNAVQQALDAVALAETRKLAKTIAGGDLYTFLDSGAQLDDEMACESYKYVEDTGAYVIARGVNIYDPGDGLGVYLVMVFVLDKQTQLSSEMCAYVTV